MLISFLFQNRFFQVQFQFLVQACFVKNKTNYYESTEITLNLITIKLFFLEENDWKIKTRLCKQILRLKPNLSP